MEEIKFTKIDKDEYLQLLAPVLFQNQLGELSFGSISLAKIIYKFSWQSELIKSEILKVKNGIYAIGIDLNVCILDFNLNKVIYSEILSSFFAEFKLKNKSLFISSQLEILEINIDTCQHKFKLNLPDIYQGLVFKNNKVEVKLMNGEKINLND